jgi:PAS domain S-box-containing protein
VTDEKWQFANAVEPAINAAYPWRERAEEKARERFSDAPDVLEVLTPENTRPLLYELRVHQIELEMQNEELRRAQAELDAARARYFDLYDLAPVGYLTVGENGLILEANLAAAGLLGLARRALVTQPFTRFIFKEAQDQYYSHRKQLLETGEPQLCELQMVKEDGTTFWARLESNAAQDANGAPICRVALSDMTESKRAEKERQQLQAQLHEAQKMEAVGQLAGGIAHDFNNLLAAVIMQLDVLRLHPDVPPEQLLPIVDEFLESAHRAADLTRQLLLFSRRYPMKALPCDANAMVSDLMKLLQRLLGEEVTLVVDIYHEPLWFEVDTSLIEQAITNLCLNARDAMPKRGRLTVATGPVTFDAEAAKRYRKARPGRFVCLRVSDTGCGMEPALMERIFEPFFTTKVHGKGTGLGLATVDGIVATHGGFVEVDSRLGKGSTFSVYLPRVAPPGATEQTRASARPVGGNESILVVEDEPGVRRMSALCLRQLGYRVTEAADGVEALQIWEREKGAFDLLFTDMEMPGGLSGLDLCLQLKQKKAGLRTVITSGYSPEMVNDANVTAQELNYLRKPFNIATLASTVRACLDRKS